jgi:hypothetical protein
MASNSQFKVEPRNLWLTVGLIILLIGSGQYLFPQAGKVCETDPDHSLEQLISTQPSGQYRLPSDLTIERGHVRWRALPGALMINYPDPTLPHYTLRPGSKGSATCRAKDHKGRWWLVDVGGRSRSGGGSRYILADRVEWEHAP